MKSNDSASASEVLLLAVIVVAWIMGTVLAKGFWSTLFSVIVPPWAWYLTVERLMQAAGLI